MDYIRLVDSSIWIAFNRLGRLDVLLRVPGITIAPQVFYELRRGKDDLAQRVAHLEDGTVEQLDVSEDVASTLIWISQDVYHISQADAVQVVYAACCEEVILYMRDTVAERVAVRYGTSVRQHGALAEDMAKLGILSPADAETLKGELDNYFSR